MQLSERITHLTPDGTGGWGLYFRARAMADAGERIVELTVGEPDARTHDDILAEMHRAAMAGHTGYAAIPGTPELRQQIAARVSARTGLATAPENVLVTAGGQGALFAAHMAVCDPGDTALYIDPYYATYPGTIRGVGAVAHPVTARAEAGFLPRPADLDAAARETGAVSLLINSPNNPTGVLYDAATLQGIADVAQARDLWLISDEVYDTQVWDGTHISPRTLPGMAERTLVIGSLSKSHAMTGSRLGWVVGPADVVARMSNLSTHTTYGVPGFIQDAGLYALRSDLEARVAAPFRRRRDLVLGLLADHTVPRAVLPQGAMYVVLDIRATGLSGNAFAEALLAEEKIAVMPGESFGRAAAGHIRVALTVEDAVLADAVARIIRFAQARRK
ncbi:pyridoxal phosphate-dependent aminotransferase [Actibacterium ureilyticum]|uniref:pyridoxal phosphate-dependent aminotransferase n=1 Tax=Actibacterium ureilyticum TaxID=1590614 RepID=UPI000BAAB1EA|nr:aminotransferase class I/II-fold pyridoxal phosphate-dependent enzyme [Actibacterium ureilyticum]